MMRVLVMKELRSLLRDGRLLALGVAVLVISIGVMSLASIKVEEGRAQKQTLERLTRAQWDQQGEKHPHRGAHFGLYVFSPETLLGAFDPGVQRQLGQAIWLEPHRRNVARFSAIDDDPMHGRLGEFTPAFVLIALLPLLIIAAAHAAIAGERESGTLRMVSGLGTRLRVVVGSKLSAFALALAAILTPVFGALWLFSGEALRVGALGLSYLIYAIIFLCVALTVSACSRTSRQSLVSLIALWLLLVWFVPRFAAMGASASVSLPSAQAFWDDIRRDYQEGLPGDGDLATRSERFDRALLREHGVNRLEDLPFGAYAVRRLNRDAYADRIHQLHFDRLWNNFAEQEAQLRRASMLSPALAMQLISMKLAGTDLLHRKAFEDAAEEYRRYFNTMIDQWDAANSRGLRSFDERYAGDNVWRSVKAFDYRTPAADAALRSILPEGLTLLGWLCATMAVLTIAARRMRS
jgi:ABC-2 type transport system permease protein